MTAGPGRGSDKNMSFGLKMKISQSDPQCGIPQIKFSFDQNEDGYRQNRQPDKPEMCFWNHFSMEGELNFNRVNGK